MASVMENHLWITRQLVWYARKERSRILIPVVGNTLEKKIKIAIATTISSFDDSSMNNPYSRRDQPKLHKNNANLVRARSLYQQFQCLEIPTFKKCRWELCKSWKIISGLWSTLFGMLEKNVQKRLFLPQVRHWKIIQNSNINQSTSDQSHPMMGNLNYKQLNAKPKSAWINFKNARPSIKVRIWAKLSSSRKWPLNVECDEKKFQANWATQTLFEGSI